ncbi:MAG: hypothetical protein D6808_00820 [Candidatus Dadabacteria bacterium]|nr:MAG: hypothetical protein D6808_00820 [Candidatus Dadabacteria bacterium]
MGLIIWILIALLGGLYITGPIADPDLWWHITTGRWIIAHRAVPVVDHWNMFGAGKEWRAYSWLCEVLFAAIERLYGVEGLMFLKAAFGVMVSLSLCYAFGRIAKDWMFGSLLGLYATVSLFNHFTLRPQAVTWALFAVALCFADSFAEGRARGKALAMLCVVSLFWANIHITSIFGILAVFLWCAGAGGSLSLSLKPSLFMAVFLLFTPYFGGEVFSLISQSTHPFSYSTVAEFQPAQINHYSTGFLVILLAVYFIFLHFRASTFPKAHLLMVALFAFMGLAVIKFMPYGVIAAGAAIAYLWRQNEGSECGLGMLGRGLLRLREIYFSHIEGNGFAVFVLALCAVHVAGISGSPLLSYAQLPVKAVDFIEKHHLPKPILNLFGDGGYLMYRYSREDGTPKMLVAIDGRTNVVPFEIMKKHSSAVRGRLDWKEYFNAVKPNTVLWRTEGPLTAILKETGNWCMVYRDGDLDRGHVVFVKEEFSNGLPCL